MIETTGLPAAISLADAEQKTCHAYEKFMEWRTSEARLMEAVSFAKQDELKEEISQARALLRESIGRGDRGSKEHKQIRSHVTSTQIELEELIGLDEELRAGAFERSLVGAKCWRSHLASRRALRDQYFDQQISAARQQAETGLAMIAPALARLVGLAKLNRRLENVLHDHISPSRPKFLGEPEGKPEVSIDSLLTPLLEVLLTPLIDDIDLELDQTLLAAVNTIPPIDMIRADLVGSPAAISKHNTLLALADKAASSAESQRRSTDRDNWSPEAMKIRSANAL
ncbi:MAG: hypothetical protein ACRC9N_12085 [Aeromonas sp.]